ncbi:MULTISPECIES: NAD-dependent malic enzyme [Desulfosediminicola]|uniref:NAD-dependent malic enzyme n=1 Tax=Desulfosediminicola TaxID=2886823 RepID=UPI0010AD8D4F|nr:NAD-dependent malic enzyme [Desulfosediminicola ganghwensis]
MSDTHKVAERRPLYISYAGPALLETPLLNKGSAFTEYERLMFNLEGLLPHNIETIEEQAERCYQQFKSFENSLDRHIYLRNIQDTNETLFFRLVVENVEEVMPYIYTPTVGKACQEFSKIYRRKRGLFISYPDRDRIDDILQNATKHNVKVIVVTDGERILGLGDQGIGGMGIPIGKLSLYTACGGISPAYTLPIVLDVGTNNEELRNDPLYMGWRNERIDGDEYFEFVEKFVQAVKRRWPDVLLQFEDFAATHASPLLEEYRDRMCCFNDDIQGTAAVTVGTLLAACKNLDQQLGEQRILFLGAGSAGCGIGEQIIAHMKQGGLTDEEARGRIALIDSRGLVTDDLEYLKDFQKPVAQKREASEGWQRNEKGRVDFVNTVRNYKPTVLIGVSMQPQVFTKEIVDLMLETTETPIILPLSNPTSKCEAYPEDLLTWTDGKAVVATGSPFDPVELNGKSYPIAQCNNSYIFPGVGLAVLASKAGRVTENMLMASSEALAECSKEYEGDALLPPLTDIREVSVKIARAVAKQAMADGVANVITDEALDEQLCENFWGPEYRNYRRTSI